MPKTVSINPSSFSDETEQDKLVAMSCEEVIDYTITGERKRTEHMDNESECEVRSFYRAIPVGLIQTLDTLAQLKSRSRRLITKCLSHQAVALMSTNKEIDEVNRLYREIVVLNGRYGGLVSIIEQIDHQTFVCANERSCRGGHSLASKLLSYFNDRERGLGIFTADFLSIGLIWSLTTAQSADIAGAVNDLHPILVDFQQYVFERLTLLRAFKAIANSRTKNRRGQDSVKN